MTVVGIDGWKSGWLGVVLRDTALHLEFHERLEYFTDRYGSSTIVVDVPIGLPVDGRRQADIAARGYVGPRASSVFLAPPETTLRAESYRAALELCRSEFGFGISAQSYALRAKILEAQDLVLAGRRLIEGHPEVSFTALKAAHLPHAKRTWNGQMERRALLESVGIGIPDELPGKVGAAPPDDVLDAAAMAWTAMRISSGQARSLPEPPEVIDGRPIAIWY